MPFQSKILAVSSSIKIIYIISGVLALSLVVKPVLKEKVELTLN